MGGTMFRYALSSLVVCGFIAVASASYGKQPPKPPARPNILFVVMDDVGIDQMAIFGYDDDNQPPTPTIAQIAGAGVMFRNTWSMPACSTSRAVFFTGRFPFRT